MISVIIPTRDRLPLLRRTVAALLAQRRPPPWEAIVVDDGSTDGTGEWLRQLPPPFRAVTGDGASGRGQARNAGARVARGDILLFLDGDMIAMPEMLRTHAALHAARARLVVSGSPWCWRETPAPTGVQRDADDLAPWLHFVTRVVSLTQEDFWAAGGFQPAFISYGFEDWELGYRLAARGHRFVMAADGSAYHQRHPTADRTLAGVRRSYGVFLRLHPDLDVALMALIPPWSDQGGYRRLLASSRRMARWPGAASELQTAALHAARHWVRFGSAPASADPAPRAGDPVLDPGVREALWWLQRLRVPYSLGLTASTSMSSLTRSATTRPPASSRAL